MQVIFYYYLQEQPKQMDLKTKGIERLMLLLSIFVGITIVFFAVLSDYTLNNILKGPVEILLGMLFLFSVGFASTWTIYGIVIFVVKGFSDPNEVSQGFNGLERLGEISPEFHPLPVEEKPKEQKSLLPWKKQIENTRSAMSKIRTRLTNKTEQKKLFKPTAGIRIIKFSCKYCGHKITVPLVHAGKRGQCLKCNNILAIPSIEKIRSVLAKSNRYVNARSSRPTFVSKAKVEAEELAKTKIWEAIRAEVVANSPLARTNAEIKGSNRPEIEKKILEKLKPKTSNKAVAVAAKPKITTKADILKKNQPNSSEFNILEVMQTVKKNSMAGMV